MAEHPNSIDTEGSDLPGLNAEQEAAFAAEEAAANAERSGMTPGQSTRMVVADEPEPEALSAPAPTPAPAPAAAAPAAAPQPSNVLADDDDPNAVLANDGKKYVPLGALTSERATFKGKLADAEASATELRQQNKLLMETLARGQTPQPQAQPTAPPPEPPKNPFDEATHPFEHGKWETQQLAKDLAEQKAWREQREQADARNRAFGEAQQTYSGMTEQFAAQNEGYADALKFIREQWVKQNLAFELPKHQAEQAARNLEWSIIGQAVNGGKNPCAVIFNMAKAVGWTKAAPEPAPGAPAPGQPAALTPAKKIELAAAGAAAAVSLSDAAGGSGPEAHSLASIVNRPKEEFDALLSGPKGEALFKQMAMGRR